MQVAIGTSGFQYPEWRGKFYPEDLSTAKMLGFYTQHFDTTESNYSFRRVPSPKTISNWFEKTPPDFRFSLKAPQRITHFAKLRDCRGQVKSFWEIVRKLDKKMGAVLFQLPPTIRKDAVLLADFIDALPDGMRAAFEFRDTSWFGDDVLDLLAKSNCALCVAESAELVTPKIATAKFGYLRLRREDYSPKDLATWADWVQRQKWSDAFIYFKHEERATGPRFAVSMRERLPRR